MSDLGEAVGVGASPDRSGGGSAVPHRLGRALLSSWLTGKSYAELVISGACPGWPAPGVEVMEALADRGVTCVGIDTPSIGPVQDAGPVHIAGFRRGLVFVEGLARLAELPVFGAFFVFLPLKIARVVWGSAAAWLLGWSEEW